MGNPNWSTPRSFFERVSAAWGPFGLDAAASKANKKCDFWFGPGSEDGPWLEGGYPNALHCDWLMAVEKAEWERHFPSGRRVYLNPPYTDLLAWVTKAAEESDKGLTVVMLLPWGQWAEWYEIVAKRAEIIRVVGRIKFIDPNPSKGKPRLCPNGQNVIAILRSPVEGVCWPTGFCGGTISAS